MIIYNIFIKVVNREKLKMIWNEALKEVLIKEFNQEGITRKEFAKRIGTDDSNFGKYLTGDKVPRIDTLIKISKELDCSLDYLLGLSKTRNIEPVNDEKAFVRVSELTGLSIDSLISLYISYSEGKLSEKILGEDIWCSCLDNEIVSFFNTNEKDNWESKIKILSYLLCSNNFNGLIDSLYKYYQFDLDEYKNEYFTLLSNDHIKDNTGGLCLSPELVEELLLKNVCKKIENIKYNYNKAIIPNFNKVKIC